MSLDEKFVVCPFNKSHIISRLRIQYHLVKCKKHFPNSKKIVCPYDATEYIDPDNFMQHLSQCKKNRRLDVTEEFKRKQFESVQHGCVNDQPFVMPQHVEVTNEWDVASLASNSSDDFEITPDERKAFNLRRQSSIAVRKACNYIPLIPHPIGRGKVSEAVRKYLNRYEHPLKSVDPNAPVLLADDRNESSIYDDADEDSSTMLDINDGVLLADDSIESKTNDGDGADICLLKPVDPNNPVFLAADNKESKIYDGNDGDKNESKLYNGANEHFLVTPDPEASVLSASDKNGIYDDAEGCNSETCDVSSSVDGCHNLSVNNDSNCNNNPGIVPNDDSKYYKPSIARGSSVVRLGGRGIPIGRGITFETNNTISSLSESFDYVLKQIISNRMLIEEKCKKDVSPLSESGNSEPNVDKLQSTKGVSLTSKPINSELNIDELQSAKDVSLTSQSVNSESKTDKLQSAKEKFALTLADISIDNSTNPVASVDLSESKQTDLSLLSDISLNKPLLSSNKYRNGDSEICSESKINVSSDKVECEAVMKEESSENIKLKKSDESSKKSRFSRTSEPVPDYSIGRGKIIRSFNFH